MRITEHSPAALVLQDRPWLESLVGLLFIGGGVWAFAAGERIFGGGFVLAGVILLVVFANTVTTRFDRAAGRVTRSLKGLVRTSEVSHSLGDITGVRVEATNSAGSPSRSYRVALALRSGARLPVSSGYSSGKPDKERLAAEIRRFLQLPEAPELATMGIGDLVEMMRDGGQRDRTGRTTKPDSQDGRQA